MGRFAITGMCYDAMQSCQYGSHARRCEQLHVKLAGKAEVTMPCLLIQYNH